MTIVYTAGTFDCFHAGHNELLNQCFEISGMDDVIVILNTDRFIEQYKGQAPLFTYEERQKHVLSHPWAPKVIPNIDGPRCWEAIREHAHLFDHNNYVIVIGDDWKSRDYAKQMGVPEKERKEFESKVMYVPYTEGISTTEIKKRCLQNG